MFLCLIVPQQLYSFSDGGDPHPLLRFIHQLVLQDVEIGRGKGEGADDRRRCIAVVLVELPGRQPLRLPVEVLDFAIQLSAGEFFVSRLVKGNSIFRWLDQTVLTAAANSQHQREANDYPPAVSDRTPYE